MIEDRSNGIQGTSHYYWHNVQTTYVILEKNKTSINKAHQIKFGKLLNSVILNKYLNKFWLPLFTLIVSMVVEKNERYFVADCLKVHSRTHYWSYTYALIMLQEF